MRIALAIDEPDWHARELRQAFEELSIRVVTIRLGDCAFEWDRSYGIAIPGFGDALPAAVFVRAVSGGSFEEVTRRLSVLHALRELGVPLWNDARAIERCVDKSMTTFLLARAGLPTPATWAVEGRDAAVQLAKAASPAEPLVLKPLFGSQGRGLRLIAAADDLPDEADIGRVYYLQKFVHPVGETFLDHRLFVCDGAVIAAMTRRSDHWITNVRRGGEPNPLNADDEMCDLAIRAAACVGASYAGVDLLRGRDGGLRVLEVNSMPGWRGLQGVASAPIADRIAKAFVSTFA